VTEGGRGGRGVECQEEAAGEESVGRQRRRQGSVEEVYYEVAER